MKKIDTNKSKTIDQVLRESKKRMPPEVRDAKYTTRLLTLKESTAKSRLKRSLPASLRRNLP